VNAYINAETYTGISLRVYPHVSACGRDVYFCIVENASRAKRAYGRVTRTVSAYGTCIHVYLSSLSLSLSLSLVRALSFVPSLSRPSYLAECLHVFLASYTYSSRPRALVSSARVFSLDSHVHEGDTRTGK